MNLLFDLFIYGKELDKSEWLNNNNKIVESQCCVNYCCIPKWLSLYTYINKYVLFFIFFHYALSQDIEYSSLYSQ